MSTNVYLKSKIEERTSQAAVLENLQSTAAADKRDLTDDEAYRHLLEKYGIPEAEFYHRLHDPAYKEKAYEEFALVKELHVTGFPTVFLQVSDTKFYLLSRGYTDYTTLKKSIGEAMAK